MSTTTEQAAVWFADRAKNTPMPGARAMFEAAATALREKAERENPPKPLTLEELRQMDGEPVWLEPNTKWEHLQGGWFLVDVDNNKLWHPFDIAGPLDKKPENYKLYRHKPKEE